VILLICGSREWTNKTIIAAPLANLMYLGIRPTVIHGNCRGADKIADKVAKKLGLPVFACDAQWETYGRAAGPVRNRWMADMEPDLVWAFHKNLMRSTGTRNMIYCAKSRDIPFKVWTGK